MPPSTLASAAVVVRRTIAASAEELFDAWLDPEALAQWMRPGTISSTVARVEPRVGGAYEIIMQAQSGPIVHKGVYRAIERPRRLVFTWMSAPTGTEGNAGHRGFRRSSASAPKSSSPTSSCRKAPCPRTATAGRAASSISTRPAGKDYSG